MPTYVFRCPDCGAVQERFCRVSELDAMRPECHGPMATVIQPVHGYVQTECHYRCPATKQGVTSWRQRRNIMAEHNLVDMSDHNPDKIIEKEQKKKEANDRLAAQMPGDHRHVYDASNARQ